MKNIKIKNRLFLVLTPTEASLSLASSGPGGWSRVRIHIAGEQRVAGEAETSREHPPTHTHPPWTRRSSGACSTSSLSSGPATTV